LAAGAVTLLLDDDELFSSGSVGGVADLGKGGKAVGLDIELVILMLLTLVSSSCRSDFCLVLL